VIEIGTLGMLEGSLRNAEDGITYMGTKKKGPDKKGRHVILNDFVLPD
jgi:hypothetical protein